MPVTDRETLASFIEALDSAYIDWERRPSRKPPAQWRNIAPGGNEDAIFLFVRNDVIEVIYGDDGPVIFMYRVKYILYIIALKSINDPIN